MIHSANWIIDELYLRRNHKFSASDIAHFSLGGEETPQEELAEDLYISDELREEIMRARKGQ